MRFDHVQSSDINDLRVSVRDDEALEVTPYAIQEANHATLLVKDDEGRVLRLKGSQEALRRLFISALAAMVLPVEPKEARDVA